MCRAVTLLYVTVVNVGPHTVTQALCATPTVSPDVNFRLWVTLMCQCSFINWTSLIGDADKGLGICEVTGDMWNLCTISQFCCKLEFPLKMKSEIQWKKMLWANYISTLGNRARNLYLNSQVTVSYARTESSPHPQGAVSFSHCVHMRYLQFNPKLIQVERHPGSPGSSPKPVSYCQAIL